MTIFIGLDGFFRLTMGGNYSRLRRREAPWKRRLQHSYGYSVSATVGTSGNWLAREDVLVAKRRTRLSASSGTTEDMPVNPTGTCPATISFTAAVAPR